MLLFQSDRRFILVSYAASHGLLLFSSPKTEVHNTRLDLLFQDVRAMELRNWFHGISVFEAGIAYLEGARSAPHPLMERGNVIYALRGEAWDGYVVGGVLKWLEWDGDVTDRSALLGDPT